MNFNFNEYYCSEEEELSKEPTELELAILKSSQLGIAYKNKLNHVSNSIKRVESVLNAMNLAKIPFEFEIESMVWFVWTIVRSGNGRIYIRYYKDWPIDCSMVEKAFGECSLETREKYLPYLATFLTEFNKQLEELI